MMSGCEMGLTVLMTLPAGMHDVPCQHGLANSVAYEDGILCRSLYSIGVDQYTRLLKPLRALSA